MPAAVVVGTGFGCRVHVPALRAAGFDVVALVGRDLERTRRRAERSGVGAAFGSLEDALEATHCDAVTIATPPSTHHDLALTAVRAGCHVLCEKPFAGSGREALEMLHAADAAGVTHLVGHEFRWAPERATIGRAIAEGRIGAPRLLTLVQCVPLVADPATRMPAWWFDTGAGGGWLGASGSHVIDQARVWLGDELASVSATLPMVSDRDARHAAEDSFVIRGHTVGGVECVLAQTAAAWGPVPAVSAVAGTHGTIWLAGTDVMLADADGVQRLAVPADLALAPGAEHSDDPAHRFTHLELGPYTRLCEVLLAGVSGTPPVDASAAGVSPPTFADGVAGMRVLDAVRASAAAGGALVPVA